MEIDYTDQNSWNLFVYYRELGLSVKKASQLVWPPKAEAKAEPESELTLQQKRLFLCLLSTLSEDDGIIKSVFGLLWYGVQYPYRNYNDIDISKEWKEYLLNDGTEEQALHLLTEYSSLLSSYIYDNPIRKSQ